uniref:Uncharacterized protein n=1 Tax=Sparus aurata TaxID=8175 RepID=A0A671U946_SPAAU
LSNFRKAKKVTGGDISTSVSGALEMIDTFDRPGKASCGKAFKRADAYANGFEDKAMKRIPKAGVSFAAGYLHAQAEWKICNASAMGPNVAGASDELGARLFAKAELASVSASVGAMKATLGLSADTGVGVGPSGVEAKFLGTGVSIGRELGFSVFGSGVTVKLW